MLKLFGIAVACALVAACATPATTPSAPPLNVVVGTYTRAEARRDLAALQQAHATMLRIAVAYVRQPACGTAGAPQPPLCARYAVGLQIKKADDAFSAAVASAEAAIENTDGSALRAAVTAATAAFDAYKAVVTIYGGGR